MAIDKIFGCKASVYCNNLYALDSNLGTLKWKYPTGSIVYSSPAIVNGIPYFGSVDGNYAIGNQPITSAPEFQSIFIPATMIIGFLAVVFYIQRTRDH